MIALLEAELARAQAATVDTESGKFLLANASARLRSPGSAACDGNVVFRGFIDKYVDAIDAVSGKQIWQLDVHDAIWGSLAVAEGRLYACSGPGTVCGINAKDGKLLWRVEIAPDPGGLESLQFSTYRCAAVHEKSVYCSSHEGKVTCLSGESGQAIWTTQLEGRIAGCSPALAEGKVSIGTLENFVYSLDAKTGNIHWKKKLGGQITSSPVVASFSKS